MSTLDRRVPMPLWVLLHAQRYAMGRMTYANTDAARLVEEYWDQLPQHVRAQMRDDFNGMDWSGPLRSDDRAAWLFIFDGGGDE